MSLINDALKRTSTVVRKQGNEPVGGVLMQPVQNTRSGSGGKTGILVILLLVVLGSAGYFLWKAYSSSKNAETAAPKTGTNAPAKMASVPAGSNNKTGAIAVATKPNGADKPAVQVKPSSSGYVRAVQNAVAVADKVSQQNREGEAAADAIQPNGVAPVQTPVAVPAPVPTPPVVQVAVAPPPAPVQPAPTPRPTVPATSNADFPAIRLQAIFYRAKGASAMINGETLREGDMIDGNTKLVKIDRESVTVAIGARTKVLPFK